MRILVLGAGALGGYFGGRLIEGGGAEVAFLVRPRRREQLQRDGLVIESPFGAFRRPVTTIGTDEAAPGWDAILLTCKAYDLPDAIAAIRPAVDSRAAILPVLNGLSHLDTLADSFGRPALLGGLAQIMAALAADGTVRHFSDFRAIVFGELDGTMSDRVQALAAAFAQAPGVQSEAVTDIPLRMWEKLVHLGTSAMATVLLRASHGEIVRAGGAELVLRMFERNIAIAKANGHVLRPAFVERFHAFFTDANSAATTSMLRDLEAGGRIESDHILGFLLNAARAAGIPDELHEAAYIHAKAYERRREAKRLPGA